MRTAKLIMIVIVAWLVGGAAGTDLDLAGELVQGGLVRGQVAPDSAVWLDGRSLRVTADGWFVLGFGRDAPASAELLVRAPTGEERRHILQIAPRTYRVQRIDGLPPRTVTPSEADLARIRADAGLLDAAKGRDTAARGFIEQMAWPVIGPISGVFGSQRILNGEPRTPHRGVDVAAPAGTPVGAMAGGVVSLAETDMYFTGGTVMLDHGHGLHSIYVHLDEVRVTVGQQLRQGQTLGTVGATGRATGTASTLGRVLVRSGGRPRAAGRRHAGARPRPEKLRRSWPAARPTRRQGRHRQAFLAILAQLVAQRADRDTEDGGGDGAIARRVAKRLQDQIALDLGHRTADEGPVGAGSVCGAVALQHQIVDADLVAHRQQDRPMHAVLELAHIAPPVVSLQDAPWPRCRADDAAGR